jgi:hypothetical protein
VAAFGGISAAPAFNKRSLSRNRVSSGLGDKVVPVVPENPIRSIRAIRQNQLIIDAMIAMLHLLGTVVANLFKSRRRLELENLYSSASAQYCREACTPAAAPWERPGHCWYG